MMKIGELKPPNRLLLGPGPSNVPERVVKALSNHIVGHLDPFFVEVMDETQELLRYAFQTRNEITIPISGTGSAGMESAIVNIVEENDKVVVGVNGFFGERMCEMVTRCGGKPIPVKARWGQPIGPEAIEEALEKRDVKAIALVHAETSTGVLQPLSEISRLARKYQALLIVDTVTSLTGCEVKVDDMSIDVCYSGTQKCLNCPPGLAPITFSPKAMAAINNRKTKVRSWYLDITLLSQYWDEGRIYHHTAPISMVYALREALRIAQEEGLEKRWARHKATSRKFVQTMEEMGLNMLVDEEYRLPSLNTILVPAGKDDMAVRSTLLKDFNIEIGGGLGELKGKIWRVGLMGINSTEETVRKFAKALKKSLS